LRAPTGGANSGVQKGTDDVPIKLADFALDNARVDPRVADVALSGIASDSRKVKPGDLFVAVPGTKADGLAFVPQALSLGAAAVMAETQPDLPPGVAFIQVANVRRALALAAATFYPRQPSTIAAVTGTSGKTSVAAFLRQIWAALGHQAASVGTVGVVSPKGETYGSLTTPDPIELHKTLDQLAGEGVTHLAMEASSHGLDQHRLDGVRVAAGGYTNLSRDHLDYHPTLEAYLAAKLRLFTDLVVDGGTAVINVDDAHAGDVVAAAKKRGLKILTVGAKGEGIHLTGTTIEGFAQVVQFAHAGHHYNVRLPLVGGFQVENAAVAAGLAIATGAEPKRVFAALENLVGAKGRLEFAGERNGAPIFIDYAHKPDALQKALEALRPYASGKLIVVFGCGGDRDVGKRPIMGRIAHEEADSVIVTDDNPRSEDPARIRAAILAEAPGAREIGDRAQAIRAGVAELQAGDVLLIAGKGHETGQIVGDRTVHFSDHEAVAAALREKVV
jgi:UDP-N-acetylmuramoyl-L-alanyl-D-glutamate--2,6-diaminopimelate ligase